MANVNNRVDVDRLKQMLADGWSRILREVPDERVYAFGIYTNECGQTMFPFLLGEKGLHQVAKGSAVEELRWSAADSPYTDELSESIYYEFDGRPDIFELSPTAFAREVNYRLTAGCTALRELDQEGLFGTGTRREGITLYIEGGDVNREWILKWAKKLNPSSVYERFAKIDAPDETIGTFAEFGSKKVYETSHYAQSADGKLLAAATQYLLFLFDTMGPKQLFAKPLPSKDDYAPLGGVAMSDDGTIIAAIPFGEDERFFIVRGKKEVVVQTVAMQRAPLAIAVSPAGNWIAVTDRSGTLNLFDPAGSLLGSHAGHEGWPRGICVSPDGATLATGDTKSLILWNTADWSRRHVLSLPVDGVDFDPTGSLLAGCCKYQAEGTAAPRAVTIFDARAGTVVREVVVDGYRIEHARFSPDGRYLACAMRLDTQDYSGTNVSALVEIESGTVIDWLKADFEQVRDFAFLPHRNEIAVAVFGHTRRPLVLWRPKGWAGSETKAGS